MYAMTDQLQNYLQNSDLIGLICCVRLTCISKIFGLWTHKHCEM